MSFTSSKKLSISSENFFDYLKEDKRVIIPKNETQFFQNKIFKDNIEIALTEEHKDDAPFFRIRIDNCEFEKGLSICLYHATHQPYMVTIASSIVSSYLIFNDPSEHSRISIQKSKLNRLYCSGDFSFVEISKSNIQSFECKYFKSNRVIFEWAKIQHFALDLLTVKNVTFHKTELAISDWSRFTPEGEQTTKDVSETYHRLALKATKTIKETTQVQYQLAKATSPWYLVFFGFFYSPLKVLGWMFIWICFFATLYSFLSYIPWERSLYFSSYTFLTISLKEGSLDENGLKTFLVLSERLLGLIYTGALITSIINSSKK